MENNGRVTKSFINGNIDFHSTKAFTEVPPIIREYQDAEGVRMYECKGDRHFIAEIYDKNFVTVKGAVKPKNHRANFYGRKETIAEFLKNNQ